MKYFLFITGIVVYLLGSASSYGQIHGTYPQDDVALSLLRITGNPNPDTLETVITRNGKFHFTTQPQEPGIYTLLLHDLDWNIPILLENGQNTISIPNLQSVRIEGGILQKQLMDCQQKSQKLTKWQIALTERLKQEKDENRQAKLRNKQLQLEKRNNEIIQRYIRNNRSNTAGLFLVWNKMEWVNFQELENRYLLLDEKLQTGPIGQTIRQRIDERWYLKPGGIARDFTIPDTSGNPVSLFDIKAKVKLLDFWASWCVPCRKANKAFVALYEKYKDQGLEIVSVSVDRNARQWKQAIRQDGYSWVQLSELKLTPDAWCRRYKVNSVPYWFLLDENNKCIASGNDEKGLEELIQKALKD